MTLPTLVANYKEKQIVTQLAKQYSILSQAWQMMQYEYGTVDTWDLKRTLTGKVDTDGNSIYDHSAQSIIAQRLKKYLNVTKTCKLNEICDPRPSYNLAGTKKADNYTINSSSDSTPEASFFLHDGTLIQIGWYSEGTTSTNIAVTLPGHKQSILGKTKFFFNATSKKLYPEGTLNSPDSSFFEQYCDPTNTSNMIGRGCTAWVIYNKNLDYLHCKDKLGWDKESSCK